MQKSSFKVLKILKIYSIWKLIFKILMEKLEYILISCQIYC